MNDKNTTEGTANRGEQQKYVTIGGAAKLLGISIDTVRRWEKAGKLVSERLDGKNRFFLTTDLIVFAHEQKLSTGEVAQLLNVSVATVRRLQSIDLLEAETDSKGKRMFDRAQVMQYFELREHGQLPIRHLVSPSLPSIKPAKEVKEVVLTELKEPNPVLAKQIDDNSSPMRLVNVAKHHTEKVSISEPIANVTSGKLVIPIQLVEEVTPVKPIPKTITVNEPPVAKSSKPLLKIKVPPSRVNKHVHNHFAANKDVYKAFGAFVAMIAVIVWLIVST